jgi:hypothetical protein
MTSRSVYFFGLCAVLLLISASPALADADPKVIAKQVCECLEEPHAKAAELMEKFMVAQHSGDFSSLMAMQDDIEGEMKNVTKASEKCFLELEKRYPKVVADDAKREGVNQIAKKTCPNNPVERLMSGRR